jgi:hypothetical protein
MKILKTNWINIAGVFSIAFIYGFISALLVSKTFMQAIFGAIFLVFGYGMMFWALFIATLVILDLVLIVRNQNSLKLKLLIEWIIISSPFIYWTVKYSEWIFLSTIIIFLITQLLREKCIKVAVH